MGTLNVNLHYFYSFCQKMAALELPDDWDYTLIINRGTALGAIRETQLELLWRLKDRASNIRQRLVTELRDLLDVEKKRVDAACRNFLEQATLTQRNIQTFKISVCQQFYLDADSVLRQPTDNSARILQSFNFSSKFEKTEECIRSLWSWQRYRTQFGASDACERVQREVNRVLDKLEERELDELEEREQQSWETNTEDAGTKRRRN